MEIEVKRKFKLSSFQIIILGFVAVIFAGAVLLMFPFSSKSREFTPFINSLFTSVSAVCVTGLIIYDTATYWSTFGQIVILFLIQIGGMGVIFVASSLLLLSGRKIGVFGRETIMEALSAHKTGGVLKLTVFILKRMFIIEFAAALIMMPTFCIDFGAKGVWMAIFHSVSAFCNAGFDIMGESSVPFSSLTYYASHPLINIVIMLLIIVGGIGFLTWQDAHEYKFNLRKYSTQSKVILIVTGALIFVPAIYYFFTEYGNLPLGKRITVSLFQSVTTRTAGFSTADFSQMSETGQAVTIMLMLIGGSPGSTAGGMKTTTVAVLIAASVCAFKRRPYVSILKRRLEEDVIKNAATIFVFYVTLFTFSGIIICSIEGLPLISCMFETASAIGTVGLTLGITSGLGAISKIILMLLMFFGRAGGLTVIYAALGKQHQVDYKFPATKITVG